jgi:hypothetical protein
MKAEYIYEKNIAVAVLCQSIGKMTSTDNKQKSELL